MRRSPRSHAVEDGGRTIMGRQVPVVKGIEARRLTMRRTGPVRPRAHCAAPRSPSQSPGLGEALRQTIHRIAPKLIAIRNATTPTPRSHIHGAHETTSWAVGTSQDHLAVLLVGPSISSLPVTGIRVRSTWASTNAEDSIAGSTSNFHGMARESAGITSTPTNATAHTRCRAAAGAFTSGTARQKSARLRCERSCPAFTPSPNP